jgi:hypothetical protein
MVAPPAAIEKHGTGIRPKIWRTIRLPKTDIKIVVQLCIDVDGYPLIFIDTTNIPLEDGEAVVRVFINNDTDPDHIRYTALREVGR